MHVAVYVLNTCCNVDMIKGLDKKLDHLTKNHHNIYHAKDTTTKNVKYSL